MSWSAPDPALVETFDATVAADPRVERRTLFGCPSAHVGGHLAATVFRDQLVLRLGDADLAPLHEGRRPLPFEPMPGRRMRELYVVPRGVVADRETLEAWIARALDRLARWPRKDAGKRRRGAAREAAAATAAADALPNLGPRSREWLARAGIDSLERLRELGAVRAYVAVRGAGGRPSLNLLWALEGAITGQRWQDVAREHRTSLLLALEDALARRVPAAAGR
jgi:DNA transformation protein